MAGEWVVRRWSRLLPRLGDHRIRKPERVVRLRLFHGNLEKNLSGISTTSV